MLRAALLWASRNDWLESQLRRRAFARRAVRRFMPGETLDAALTAAGPLVDRDVGVVLTRLGENVSTGAEADEVEEHYSAALRRIAAESLDADLSVKLTQLGVRRSVEDAGRRLLRLAGVVEETGRALWVDMEESDLVDTTLALFHRARERTERVGICLQAYLYRTPADIEALRGAGARIRLVKGAYRESPDRALQKKSEVDARFRELALQLLEDAAAGGPPPVLGTHDVPLVESVMMAAPGTGRGALEVHMLYGIRTEDRDALAAAGHPVRVLISYGEAWYPWYVRRLAERPANLLFLARNLAR